MRRQRGAVVLYVYSGIDPLWEATPLARPLLSEIVVVIILCEGTPKAQTKRGGYGNPTYPGFFPLTLNFFPTLWRKQANCALSNERSGKPK